MTLYFTGLDSHNCVLPIQKSDKSVQLSHYQPQCSEAPQFVKSNLKNIQMRQDFIVFQRAGLGNEFVWFIKGDGISGEIQIFGSDSGVSVVCFTANSLVGFDTMNNSLCKIDFKLNYDTPEYFSWSYSFCGKKLPDSPSAQIKQIVTNSQTVYVLDDHSGIYEVSSDNLILKWRLEGVVIVKLVCGFGHFVLLSDTGALYSWGAGGRGELGHYEHDHVMVNCESPKRIEFFDDLPCIVKDVVCGGWHTLCLTSDGDIYSFGWNESGQLGHALGEKLSSVGGVPYPIDLGSADDPVIQISAGARHSVAVLKSGRLYSCGLNNYGQLGLADFENRSEPVEIKLNYVDGTKPIKMECGRWCTFFYF